MSLTGPIRKAEQSLNPSGVVYLYKIDFSTCLTEASDTVLHITPFRDRDEDGTYTDIVFNGQTYAFASIDLTGITMESGGKIMQPTLTYMSANKAGDPFWLAAAGGDVRGMTVTRLKVYVEHLDNRRQGSFVLPRKATLFIDGLSSQSGPEVVCTMTPHYGIEGVNANANRMLSEGSCGLKYRIWTGTEWANTKHVDGGCPYGQPDEAANYPDVPNFGTALFTSSDEVTDQPAMDRCSLTVGGRLKRFPTGPIPFEGLIRPVGGNC